MKKNIEKEKKYFWNMINEYSSYALTGLEYNKLNEKQVDEFMNNNLKNNESGYPQYMTFIRHFGEAIPNKRAVKEIIKFTDGESILEIGSGMGLWAYILQLYGATVYPTDNFPHLPKYLAKPQANLLAKPQASLLGYNFTNIERIDSMQALKKYNNIDVLLLWEDIYNTAHKTLKHFKGNRLIFIGELMEDASISLIELLEKNWKIYKRIELKSLIIAGRLDDDVYLFIRK